MLHNALDLISCQKAEIKEIKFEWIRSRNELKAERVWVKYYKARVEKLKALISKTNEYRGEVIHAITHIDEIKSEAYKEFAERLKLRFIADSVREVINETLTELTERKEDEGK